MTASKKSRRWPDLPEPLAAPVTDNHTHLPLRVEEIPEVQGERPSLEEQLRRAAAVGVHRIVTVGCELNDLEAACALTRLPGVFAAVAIHPNEAPLHAGALRHVAADAPDGLTPTLRPHHEVDLDDALSAVAKAARHPDVVAIGESGLDFFRGGPGARAAQVAAFRAHIALAKELDLPLQIHDRDAHAEVIETLLADGAPERTVFHCFSGDVQMAQVLAEHGWYASIAGPLTYHANDYARAALDRLPRELVLVETDAPYLAPHPLRGRPNASYVMPVTVRAIAQRWGVDEAAACAQLEENTQRVYRFAA
ncbi:TatD family hydrolase [Buchananella felis]|uniref:TatD family hydrolase n=1 Tax=Buchananella felis TaxID=3231492 RepID=UPI0035279346